MAVGEQDDLMVAMDISTIAIRSAPVVVGMASFAHSILDALGSSVPFHHDCRGNWSFDGGEWNP